MIPMHLRGKTAAQIMNGIKDRFIHRINSYDNDEYIVELENLLLQAVEDAMMNASKKVIVNEMILGIDGPTKRGVDFLNRVLPED